MLLKVNKYAYYEFRNSKFTYEYLSLLFTKIFKQIDIFFLLSGTALNLQDVLKWLSVIFMGW